MKPFSIAKDIYWVGAAHPELCLFDDVYPTKKGSTYNAYLIKGKNKIALVDTVKYLFTKDFLKNLRELCPFEKIDYLIVNHTEPDHAGSIAEFLKLAPHVQVILTKPASIFLKAIINSSFNFTEVSDSLSLDLGGRTLKFVIAPFLHWPDTMFTYLVEDKILFTCDAFGSHFYDERMFNDEVADFWPEFEFYLDSIIRPFKKKILEAIEKIKDLPITMIAPSHGPILRQDPMKYVQRYKELATVKRATGDNKKILILYISSHKNIEHMTQYVAEGLKTAQTEVQVIHVTEAETNQIRDAIEMADGVLIGSNTINRDIPKPIWDILQLFSTVAHEVKLTGVFSSYGWSGEAPKMIEDRFKSLKLKVFEPSFKVNFVPAEEDFQRVKDFGKKFAEELCR